MPADAASDPTFPAPTRRTVLATIGVCVLGVALVALVWAEAAATAPVRDAMRAYSELVAAGNRGDLPAARKLCSGRFLADRPVALAEEGGIVGVPRSIHKNFKAWRQGPDVWICPTNRIGPVYRLIRDGDHWRFDGLVGELRPGNAFVPAE
jgi:hypothetical protein